MTQRSSAIYSGYGAHELKASYQRNFALGTASTLAFVLLILLVFWIISAVGGEKASNITPILIQTVADLGPPPTIAKKPPQVKVDVPQAAMPKVGIPTPVADDEVLDDDVVIASRQDLAEIIAPDLTQMDGADVMVDIADDDYLPVQGEFVPYEKTPEMIYKERPEYPRLARQAGIEGLVYVTVLVLKDGSVKESKIGKSSGTAALDEAAVKAAYKNKFAPAIQNGRPVACWVTYKMEFIIGR